MAKQPMTRAQNLLRAYRPSLKDVPRDVLHNLRLDIATAIAEAETRGTMIGAAVCAGCVVNTFDEPSIGAEMLRQFAPGPVDWRGLDLTNFDMRAVRVAFKMG